jgi:putative membrane protein
MVTAVLHATFALANLGKLAQQRAADAEVRDYGSRMGRFHAAVHEELSRLAAASRLTLPAGPGDAHRADQQRLSRVTGREFDRAYVLQMVKDQEVLARLLEQAAREHEDDEMGVWAEKTLTVVRGHLHRARVIGARLGGDTSGGSVHDFLWGCQSRSDLGRSG